MGEVQGVSYPPFLYGTAWKEDRTAELTRLALARGFTGIDTANQRKHYFEAGVGEAIREVARDGLFLQSKFTYARGQDHRLPYDPEAPLADQVAQSFESSLEHLGTDYLDSYVLHGPELGRGLSDGDREVWRAMEALQRAGKTRLIGVSNIAGSQLELLIREAEIQPAFVQNRCFARTGWDREVRALCAAHGIVYQGFSLLTANRRELASPSIGEIARRNGMTVPQLVFRFAIDIGMLPLTGTTSADHMTEDLACLELALAPDDRVAVERVAG